MPPTSATASSFWPTTPQNWPTPRVSAARSSRGTILKDATSPSLEQAVELAAGVLPREYASPGELTPAARRMMWPTPTVNMAPQANSNARQWGGYNSTETLAVAIEQGRWPTPAAADGERTSDAYMGGNPTLLGATRRWPTPQARDGDGRAADASRVGDPNRHGGHNLDDWVKLWNTPRSSGASLSGGSNSRKTAIRNGSYISGSLNPEWVEMLQGFPQGWTATAGQPCRARSSTRGSRPAPSARASPTEAAG